MKVLMVGCGAVGQVFGLHLQKAGVELGLYDRPATVDKLKQASGTWEACPFFKSPNPVDGVQSPTGWRTIWC